jgi:hypothetical protein
MSVRKSEKGTKIRSRSYFKSLPGVVVGNGTSRRTIANAAECVNATQTAGWLYFDVLMLISAEEVGIAGNVVGCFVVFECPGQRCAVNLLQVCDTVMFGGRGAAAASEMADNRRRHGEDTCQTRENVNGRDASRFFQTDSDTAGGVPTVAGLESGTACSRTQNSTSPPD